MKFLNVNWPAPKNVKAFCTMQDLQSPHNYNVALHVEDDLPTVLANREELKQTFSWKNEPIWLNQTHSNHCISIDSNPSRDGDAAVTKSLEKSLIIMTADCLPILICHQSKPEIAAIHAGWRGLFDGIIENTFEKLQDDPSQYIAWFGPCICQDCYNVQEEFKQQFLSRYPDAENCFISRQQPYFSLTGMASHILNKLKLKRLYHSNICTYENNAFYSYRRQNKTGRIASMIWLENQQ